MGVKHTVTLSRAEAEQKLFNELPLTKNSDLRYLLGQVNKLASEYMEEEIDLSVPWPRSMMISYLNRIVAEAKFDNFKSNTHSNLQLEVMEEMLDCLNIDGFENYAISRET